MIRGEALVVETSQGPVFLLLKATDEKGDLKEGVMRALAPAVAKTEEPYSWAVVKRLAGVGASEVKGDLPREA